MNIIYYQLNYKISDLPEMVAAIGFFDGIHLGHLQLINKAIEVAKAKELQSALITFAPSIESVLTNKEEHLLTPLNEKIEVAKKSGIDNLIIIKFSKILSQLSPKQFYEKLLKKLNITNLVCGEDFKFGFRGSGDINTLKDFYGNNLSVISDYLLENQRISSTLIKKTLLNNDLELVNKLLTYPYQVIGYVVSGRQVGRKLGFPTINILVEQSKILPNTGVYSGYVEIDNKLYQATINVGYNPTINQVEHKSIEAYIHNVEEDFYNKKVTIKFMHYLRAELKFDNKQQLIEQMQKDIVKSEQLLKKGRD